MERERWLKVERIYHAAREREASERSRFVAEACAGDDVLRLEVESLLAQGETTGSFMNAPALQVAAQGLAKEREGAATPDVMLGRAISHYRIIEKLGGGGMGVVYKAQDARLGRVVALKFISELGRSLPHPRETAPAIDPAALQRFQREARAASALNHPNICTIHDIGEQDGQPFIAMELLEGESLSARLKQGRLPREEALRYAIQIAEALAEAHARGIVHRDLKPSNIMLTRHGVKVLDFGLAKMLEETGITETRAVMGTPAYMAPEQVTGGGLTAAADLFAFGLVLYEMMAGKPAVPGASLGQMLASGTQAPITPLCTQFSDLPPELDELVQRLLAKDASRRPSSAAEVARSLSALLEKWSAPPASAPVKRLGAIGATVLLILLLAGSLIYRRQERIRWVREEATPQIAQLSPKRPLAAYVLLRKSEEILPGDPQLAEIEKSTTLLISVESDPAGATVSIRDYDEDNSKVSEWFKLGETPLKTVRVPKGYFGWMVSKPGYGEYVSAPPTEDHMRFPLAEVHQESGMVPVPGGNWGEFVDFIGWVFYKLPSFDIDRYEVTNGEYQRFVDEGGYRKPEYWKEKFMKDGKELSWDDAMALLRDPTGRPGPSTWEAGHFPPGQEKYPVSGVSWYEAAAYAAYAGKSLPVLGQWYKASPGDLAPYAANVANFSGKGPAPVGSSSAVGPYGTYDMAGNVREWSLTATGDDRFILGGAWSTQPYLSFDPAILPPFDRSPQNGFRTVRNKAPLSAEATAPLTRQGRDFSREKPASDEVFQAYKAMYAYDPAPLNAQDAGVLEETADWSKQKITIDAGYEGQRLPMYLFIPKNVRPPIEAVLFFPSARVELMNDSHNLGDMQFVDYVIKSGRALLYPVYIDTYERRLNPVSTVGSIKDLQETIQRSKEVRRAMDYLATRADIASSKVAYLGVSMGSAYGVIFTVLDGRFRTAIFLDGGFFLGRPAKGRDQLDFAPRLKIPVLMINGKYDFSFSPDLAQEPMFRMLGTDAADKRRVLFDTPHDISEKKEDLSREVLAWLDKYLGRVN